MENGLNLEQDRLIRAITKSPITPFNLSDLEWISDVADLWGEPGEREAAERILRDEQTVAYVVEPFAVAAVYPDGHGLALVGTCSRRGIKSLHRLGDYMVALANIEGSDLHSHCIDKTMWQYKFFTSYLGFQDNGDVLVYYAVKGN